MISAMIERRTFTLANIKSPTRHAVALAAHTASACALSASLSLCFVIHSHWGGGDLFAADGTVRIYRIGSFLLMLWAAIISAHYYLSVMPAPHRALLAMLCAVCGVGMAMFVMTASATTFGLLYPGIVLLIVLAIIVGAIF